MQIFMQFGAFFMFLLRLVYFGISAELRQSDRCDQWSGVFFFVFYFPDWYAYKKQTHFCTIYNNNNKIIQLNHSKDIKLLF